MTLNVPCQVILGKIHCAIGPLIYGFGLLSNGNHMPICHQLGVIGTSKFPLFLLPIFAAELTGFTGTFRRAMQFIMFYFMHREAPWVIAPLFTIYDVIEPPHALHEGVSYNAFVCVSVGLSVCPLTKYLTKY